MSVLLHKERIELLLQWLRRTLQQDVLEIRAEPAQSIIVIYETLREGRVGPIRQSIISIELRLPIQPPARGLR